ncbi:MAG: hypothetical protein K8T26_19465 [Lentisphaerae bacterium]|nr:hypothetical protein [Lentisphaerota bacterium]
MKCHKCPHAEAVAAGKYREVPFEQTPCATCKLAQSSVGTKAYDPAKELAPDALPEPPSVWEDLVLPLTVMAEVVRILLALPQPLRDTVCLRYCRKSYKAIAARMNTTPDLAEKRHKRAMAKYPALKALFPVKVSKQSRRRPRKRANP